MPTVFVDLPQTVIVEILAQVGSDDLGSLFNASLACQLLYSLVHEEDQAVWRTIHSFKYDDPTRACAFLTSRTGFDWRKRVVDRAFAARFLALHADKVVENADPSPQYRLSSKVKAQVPRVFQAILGLYLDLPAQGAESANVPILEDVMASRLFYYLCITTGYHNNDCKHLEAVLGHLDVFDYDSSHYSLVHPHDPSVYEYFSDDEQPDDGKPHGDKGDRNSSDVSRWADPMGSDTVPWFDMAIIGVDSTCCAEGEYDPDLVPSSRTAVIYWFSRDVPNDHHLDSKGVCLAQYALAGGIDAVRGHSLLGLHRPTSSNDMWDWASASGRWFGVRGRSYYTRRGRDVSYYPLGQFHLTAAHDASEVTRFVIDSGIGIGSDELWTSGPHCRLELGLDKYTHPLPPLHFHGTGTFGDASAVIYGVVHLTNDDPPELKWTIGTIEHDQPTKRNVIIGFQLGVCGSRRGVIGRHEDMGIGTEPGQGGDETWCWKIGTPDMF